MRRILALLLAVALVVAAAPAAGSAKSPQKKRTCVTKVVKKKTKTRKAVKKRVCRVTKTKAKMKPATAPRTSTPATAPANAPRPWFPSPAPAGTPAAPSTPGAGAPSVPATPAAEPTAPTPVCEDDSMWLGAFAREDTTLGFRLDLSRECIRAGRVIVRYLNTDQAHHNLYVKGVAPAAPARKVVDLVAPKAIDSGDTPGQQDGTADLTAGTWRFYCAIPGHEVMTRDLTVTPAS